jgi:hypothetical protein
LKEEPLYPTTGIVSRRAPVVESKGPVFELKLNITDSEVCYGGIEFIDVSTGCDRQTEGRT